MGASDDEDDYVFYGTPIDEDEDTRAGQRRKQNKDPALTRQLPLHKQVATLGMRCCGEHAPLSCWHSLLSTQSLQSHAWALHRR